MPRKFTDGTIISAADEQQLHRALRQGGRLEETPPLTLGRVWPAGSSLVYDGYAASGAYDQNGGGAITCACRKLTDAYRRE